MELHKLEEELVIETQLNSQKLNVIAVLQDESNYLNEILVAQERDFEKSLRPHRLNLDRDLEKLTAIDKHQKDQIQVWLVQKIRIESNLLKFSIVTSCEKNVLFIPFTPMELQGFVKLFMFISACNKQHILARFLPKV